VRIAIYGAGAIGGFIGARLARGGSEVAAIARGATAAALRRHGWRLEIDGARLAAPARVAEDPAELGPHDLVVVAVKGHAMPAVAQRIGPLLGPQTIVLTAMNGVPWWFLDGFGGGLAGRILQSVDPGGRIAAAIPTRHVVGCVVHATCSAPEPGLARHGFGHRLIIGEPAGAPTPRVDAVAALLRGAGFEIAVSPRIQADIWYKLWGNMTMNPLSALTGATCDRLLDDPGLRGFCLRVMEEAASIGAAIGCPIAESGEDRIAVTRKLGAFKTSMLQDAESGRTLEIDALVGAVDEIAALAGVPAPETAALLGLIRLYAQVRHL
jgi:2-dehydropantoate 2-reductase